MSDHYLFSQGSTLELARALPQKAMEELKSYPENVFLATPVEDIVAKLVHKYHPTIPTLDEDGVWVEDKEETYQPRHDRYNIFSDRYGPPEPHKFHVVVFHLPFSGDSNLFRFQPSRAAVPGPKATVQRNELLITVQTQNRSPEQVKAEFEAVVKSIKEHMATSKADLVHVSSQIEGPARTYFQERKEQLLRSKGLVASLGFPMKRRADAPTTFVAPEVRRTVVPVRPATTAPFKPEPALEEREYANILSVMENMTKVMERSPHTFVNMGEEDIRQHYLVQLNSQYEGQASGETFNYEGKTDILIRSEGRNIFIAECKFWHGEKSLTETVDQLLSYLSWRDTKTAVVIFNRNKNLSGVIDTAKATMTAHRQYKRGPSAEGETRFRYVFGNPGDHNREVIVTLMIFDIPTRL